MTPASAKAKGRRLEAWVAAALSALGIAARRQPGSGVYRDFPCDVQAIIGGEQYLVECKSWRHGWRTGDAALGKADLLVIKRDRGEPQVFMPWPAFVRLVSAAQRYDARRDAANSYDLAVSVMRRAVEIERTGVCREQAIKQAMAEDAGRWRAAAGEDESVRMVGAARDGERAAAGVVSPAS